MPSCVDNYLKLRARLDVPPTLVLTGEALVERLHPHTPPLDADWPPPDAAVPGVSRVIGDMLWRLPHPSRVLCAVTAAEMVLPIWEAWAAAREGERQRDRQGVATGTSVPVDAPRQAIGRTYATWDAGSAQPWDYALYDRLVAACQQASEVLALAPAAAARAASNAYRAANANVFSFRGKSAFSADALAAAAVDDACSAYDEFHAQHTGRQDDLISLRNAWFHRWWDRCRCRLAFAGVTTALLQ